MYSEPKVLPNCGSCVLLYTKSPGAPSFFPSVALASVSLPSSHVMLRMRPSRLFLVNIFFRSKILTTNSDTESTINFRYEIHLIIIIYFLKKKILSLISR